MNRVLYALMLFCWLGFSTPSSLADFDVDEADSLDFGSFHENDDEQRQLWKDKRHKIEEKKSKGNVKIQARAPLANPDSEGASGALNRLYHKMQDTCPQGWDQFREWAAPDNGILYLYKEFQCRAEP